MLHLRDGGVDGLQCNRCCASGAAFIVAILSLATHTGGSVVSRTLSRGADGVET